MAITPLPTPPSRNDPANFSARGDAFLGALPTFATEANELADEVNEVLPIAQEAQAAAEVAIALVNYKGDYSAGTTYTVGQSVTYLNVRFMAKKTNTGITPVDGADWYEITSSAEVTVRSILNQSSAITLLPSDGGGYFLVSSTAPIDLNLPDATQLAGRTFVIKNIGDFVIFVDDNAGNYLFPLPPQESAAIWASGVATAAGQWAIEKLPTDFSAPNASLGSLGQASAPGNYVFGKISTTQQVFTFAQSQSIAGTRPYAMVITQSSGTLTFGTPYELANELCGNVSVAMLSSTTGVATWSSGDLWRACVISVSGNVITPGTPVTISTAGVYGYPKAVALSAGTLIAGCYSTLQNISMCVLTVSGTTITAGTVSTANSGNPSERGYDFFLGALSATQAVISYESSGSNLNARTVDVSGTTISYGTNLQTSPTGSAISAITGCVFSSSVSAIVYENGQSLVRIRAISVSGTTCTFGSETTVLSAASFTTAIGAMTDGSGIVSYTNSTSTPRYKGFTRSGTSFSIGPEVVGSSNLNGNFTFQGLQGFAAPSVGTPNSASFMSSNINVTGVNVQPLSLSGTTVSTVTTFTYPVPSFFDLSDIDNTKLICALSPTRAISIGGRFAANGVQELAAFLVDYSSATPTVLQVVGIGAVSEFASIDAISGTQAVVVYRSSAPATVANVITMSGDTISVGAQATISSATTTTRNSVCRLTATTAIAFYRLSSSNASANVLTVSGSSITVGAATQISIGDIVAPQVQALTSTTALAVFNQSGAKGTKLTISGTSITFTPPVSLPGVSSNYYHLTAISSTKCVVGSGSSQFTNNGVANVITISGDTITTSAPSNVLITQEGLRLSFTSPRKGVAISPTRGWSCSFYVSGDLLYFSPQQTSIGKHLTALQAPATASPSASKVALFGKDGYSLFSNQIFSSGAIN